MTITTIDQIKELAEQLPVEEHAALADLLRKIDRSPYTATEVLVALGEAELLEDDWDELAWTIQYNDRHTLPLRGQEIPLKVIETDDGGEYGYDTFIIIRVGEQLFRKSGYFQSHYGNDWDGPFVEVALATETITVYKEV